MGAGILPTAIAPLLLAGCGESRDGSEKKLGDLYATNAGGDPLDHGVTYQDNADAAIDLIVPAERDDQGNVTAPGAREAGAGRVLSSEGFGLFALAQGFVPALPPRVVALLQQSGDAFRASLNVDLDALATLRRPLVAFRDLPLDLRLDVLAGAFADPDRAGAMLLLRAACFAAYLGGITSDVGLRALGFPAYENFDDGLAVSGYPRTKSTGRLIDAAKEDLAALAAQNELDDYTYDRAPSPTPLDDLTLVIGPTGDLL